MKLSYHRQTTSRSQNMMHIMDIFQAKLYLYITQKGPTRILGKATQYWQNQSIENKNQRRCGNDVHNPALPLKPLRSISYGHESFLKAKIEFKFVVRIAFWNDTKPSRVAIEKWTINEWTAMILMRAVIRTQTQAIQENCN